LLACPAAQLNTLQVGGIYQISKASLKPRNAKFNNTPHDYEIYLERSSTVQPCEEDHETRAIPMMMFHVSSSCTPAAGRALLTHLGCTGHVWCTA
jgi:replication factor A1